MDTLFSEHWHLVRHVKPKLREAVEVFPRRLRGRTWVFLHDQMTQKFVRLTPEAWLIIKKMDGKTRLETLWEESCIDQQTLYEEQRFYKDEEPQIIGQHDLVNLLSQLYSHDMLQTQLSADAGEIVKRYKKQKFQNLKQSYFNPVSIKIPLFYPDAWFEYQAPLARRLYTWLFFFIWLVVVAPAVFLAGANWPMLTSNLSDRVLSGSNLFVLWCTYPIVKAIHEWAHGMAVKAWGGVVREVGLMLIIFMPVPYVDATYAYRFTSKWTRALVAATGVMAELFLGAIAVYVWVNTEPGLVRAFAFNVIFIAGVSSLLVNGNPLMKYDGYYTLSNIIEIPNLAQRAKNYWVYLSDRYFFGVRTAKPPSGYELEKAWLFVYGFLAPIYRTLIVFSIIWFIAQKYFVVGVIMALVSVWMSFIVPIYKGLKHVFRGNSLMKKRVQAKRRFYLASFLVLAVLFFMPAPFYSMQQGIVWIPEKNIVRSVATGEIETVIVQANEPVVTGQPLLRVSNSELEQKYLNIRQQIESIDLSMRNASTQDIAKYYDLSAQRKSLVSEQQLVQKDVEQLTITSSNDGMWFPLSVNEIKGLYVKKGDVIGHVIPEQGYIIKVVINQGDMSLINQRLNGVKIKTVTNLNNSFAAKIIRKTPKASFELPSAAFGIESGGDIVIDVSDGSGKKSVERMFDVDLALVEKEMKMGQPLSFNDRVHVRFNLGYLPYGWQSLIRMKQLLLNQFDV